MNLTKLTEEYIDRHISVKDSLRKGIINYSSLARLVIKDSGLQGKTKPEAIVIAARRYRERIKGQSYDKKVLDLFKTSEIETKNKISVVRLTKQVIPEYLTDLEKEIKKRKDIFFAIEGTKTITVIVQQRNVGLLRRKFKNSIDSIREDLAMFIIESPGIEDTPGAVAYITSLFFENDVNIVEMMSCYNDTILIVDSEDVSKILQIMKF